MPVPHVVTVSGPLPALALGVVDAHDHLFIASPALPGGEIDDPERVIAEVREAKATGDRHDRRVDADRPRPQTRPDAPGLGGDRRRGHRRDRVPPRRPLSRGALGPRRADRPAHAADAGRPHGGMHPRDWEDDSPPDPARAGVIKMGASYQHISPGERRRLEAAAAASARHRRRDRGPHRGRHLRPRDRRCPRERRRDGPTGSRSLTWTATPTWSSTPRSPRAA